MNETSEITSTMEALRNTGRTTRVIEDAIRLAREGRAVYVLGADYGHAKVLQRIIDKRAGKYHGIKCESPGGLGTQYNWDTGRLEGAHPNCVVLIDHHAIERRYAGVIEMLHRYDPPMMPQPDGRGDER